MLNSGDARVMERRRWKPSAIVLVLMVLAFSGLASTASARTRSRLVPHSVLKGVGAFMGPVRTVGVDGIRIGYRRFGRGPDLLMVTGDTAPMSLWMPYLLRPLARRFRVTIFDNRGVGYSTDRRSVPMTVPLMARDTDGLIRALGLKRTTVVGWSMGGEIGITMAERYPHAFARLVTTGADAGSRHTIPPPPGLIRKLNGGSVTAALKLLFPSSPAGAAAQARFIRGYTAIPQEPVSRPTLKRQEQAENAFLRYPKVWARLGAIRRPVLITNGALDRGVPVQNARNLHRLIRGSRLSIYDGAAHGMLFQDAARFAAQITHFAHR